MDTIPLLKTGRACVCLSAGSAFIMVRQHCRCMGGAVETMTKERFTATSVVLVTD